MKEKIDLKKENSKIPTYLYKKKEDKERGKLILYFGFKTTLIVAKKCNGIKKIFPPQKRFLNKTETNKKSFD